LTFGNCGFESRRSAKPLRRLRQAAKARDGIETSPRQTYAYQCAMPRSLQAARAAAGNSPRPCRRAPLESLSQAGSPISSTAPWRRYAKAPNATRARPHAVPKPIAASLQLKPLRAATVTTRGRRPIAVPALACFVLARADREQYWWQVPNAACTAVGGVVARELVPGPQRPAVAAAGTRTATATTIARVCTRRAAWRCMASPFVVRRGLRRQRCSWPVGRRLITVNRRLRAGLRLA
jgi:hypothetical protein